MVYVKEKMQFWKCSCREERNSTQNKNGLIEELYSIINLSEFKWIN